MPVMLELADAILACYKKLFSEPLAIERESVAVEIIGHIKTGGWTENLPVIGDFVHDHVETIDIGEKANDSNRFLWDGIAKVQDFLEDEEESPQDF